MHHYEIKPQNASLKNKPELIDLNLDEHNQGLCHYPFIISLDRCNGIYNTVDNPSSRICVLNKTEDASLKVFNKLTRRNDAKELIKSISCNWKCKFNGKKYFKVNLE